MNLHLIVFAAVLTFTVAWDTSPMAGMPDLPFPYHFSPTPAPQPLRYTYPHPTPRHHPRSLLQNSPQSPFPFIGDLLHTLIPKKKAEVNLFGASD
ncbi:hypothetical protein L596_028550 [Steinernema carpocapsae]|uniref:Uncharacterized protein n=1 Tax=Steinernema carpocapsae TaxID=34508 RepID=A0A4U5LYR0_STECR|nr:hypothetical protein L596_028550 [Steinernema carpocapsae]